MEFLVLLLLFTLALAGDGQDAIFDRHFDFLFFHFRQVRLDQVFLVILGDVHFRGPIGQRDVAVGRQAFWKLSEEAA